MSAFANRACQTFRKVCAIPTIASARVADESEKHLTISLSWKQQDLERNAKKDFTTTYIYNKNNLELTSIGSFPEEQSNVLMQCSSDDLSQRAVFRTEKKNGSDDENTFCEIWSKKHLSQCINLSVLDIHGKVHPCDGVFGSCSFSPDGNRVLYLAEKKKGNICGYFERKKATNTPDDRIKGEKFSYTESWGEQMTDISDPVICVLDLQSEVVSIVQNVPDDVSPSSSCWGPESSIVFIGLYTQPRRLGRIYCENRPSDVFVTQLAGEDRAQKIGTGDREVCVHSVKVSPSKRKLAYQQRLLTGTGDPHRGASMLVVYDLESKTCTQSSTILPVSSQIDSQGGIPAPKSVPLFSGGSPKTYWLNDERHIVLANIINGSPCTVTIDTETFMIEAMVVGVTLLSVFHSSKSTDKDSALMLLSKSQLNSTEFDFGVCFAFFQGFPECRDTKLSCSSAMELLPDLELGCIEDVPGLLTLRSFYLLHRNSSLAVAGRSPLIVWPHGGPHSLITAEFNRYIQAFAQLGFAVLLLNYRGSFGFDLESLDSLPGNIGRNDVDDCQAIVKHFLALHDSEIDQSRMIITGGSHGGFLTAHLIGQFPEFYCAAALRNPVINLVTMLSTTDIPDWDAVESGFPYRSSDIPDVKTCQAMLEKSPIVYAPQVKTPVLLCLGGKDLRVPPSQGIAYHNALRANEKVSKICFYPNDCHPISNVESEADVFMNMSLWFHEHMSA